MASLKGMGQHCQPLSQRRARHAFQPAVPSSCRRPATRVFCQPSPIDQQQSVAPVFDANIQPGMTPGYPVPAPPPGTPLDSSSSAVYMQAPPPPGYGYQVQGRDGQQYYMAPPPGYYPPPPPYAAPKAETSSGAPWWIWVGVGVAASSIFGKVQELMKKGPQQMMAEMAMKQMMGSMGNQANSPFGKPGAMPPFPGGFPPMPPTGFPSPPTSPTVDVSSSPPAAAAATSTPATDSSTSSTRKGEKFASRMSSGSPAPSGTTSSTSTKEKSDAEKSMDVVEPIVKEPASSRGSASSSSFFAQASSSDSSKSSSAGAGTSGNGASSAEGSGNTMMDTMEAMLRNPQMQQMLYPYLPEPMRNPQSIEWMLNNPEVKKQMAQMFESQNMMSPEMMNMMKNMDLNQDKVNQQFQELGLKPEDVISKVMANPELAAGFQDPKVQAAIMDISQNPMNIVKYQSDPQVMKVLNEVTTLFQPDIPPNKRF